MFKAIPVQINLYISLPYVVIGLAAISAVGGLCWRWWRQRTIFSSLRSLPSPRGHWLLGNFPALIAAAKAGRLTNLLYEWYQKFGDIFVIWNFGKAELMVANPKLIQNILVKGQKQGTFQRGGFGYKAYEDVFGVHLGNQVGYEWKWRRQAWTPALASSRVSQKFDVIFTASQNLVEAIKQAAQKNEVVKVDPLFLEYTMSIIAYFMLGIPLDRKTNPVEGPPFEPQKIYSALAVLEKQVLLQGITGNKWLKYLPTKQNQTYWDAQRYLKEFLTPRADIAIKLARNEEDEQLEQVSQQFKDSMSVQMAKQPQYTPQNLTADLRAALFAGHDTTSHTLSFAVGELALNPKVFRTAREIVERVMNNNAIEDGLSAESLKELAYVEAIFKETMRLHPVVPQISIVATRDTSIQEVKIPENTLLRLQFMAAGRNSDMYQYPDEFRPERWLKAGEDNDVNGNEPLLLGFSLGPHYCLGAPLALLEATVILSLLIRHFDWELVNGRSSLEELDQNLTVFSRDRVPVKFKVREIPEPGMHPELAKA